MKTPAPDSLVTLKANLAILKTRYTEQHPDVRALQSRIDMLEKAAANQAPDAPPADPAAAAAEMRVREARIEIESLRQRLADVDRRIAAFQERVEAAPRREQEVLGLMRDYQKLSENYSALLSKKLDAEMAARLERQQKGQQFRVLDPAYLPEQPSFPNRGMFALAGLGIGILLGVGLGDHGDALDPTIKDAESVRSAFSFPGARRDPVRQAAGPGAPRQAAARRARRHRGGRRKKRRGGGAYAFEAEAENKSRSK
jgi:uncharacterized protein involved in exopolysaccharide biosynthesis